MLHHDDAFSKELRLTPGTSTPTTAAANAPHMITSGRNPERRRQLTRTVQHGAGSCLTLIADKRSVHETEPYADGSVEGSAVTAERIKRRS